MNKSTQAEAIIDGIAPVMFPQLTEKQSRKELRYINRKLLVESEKDAVDWKEIAGVGVELQLLAMENMENEGDGQRQ